MVVLVVVFFLQQGSNEIGRYLNHNLLLQKIAGFLSSSYGDGGSKIQTTTVITGSFTSYEGPGLSRVHRIAFFVYILFSRVIVALQNNEEQSRNGN